MNLRELFGGSSTPEPKTPAFYEIALDAITSGVMVADKNRNIIYANPAVYNLQKTWWVRTLTSSTRIPATSAEFLPNLPPRWSHRSWWAMLTLT